MEWKQETRPKGAGLYNERIELERLRARLDHRPASPWTWGLVAFVVIAFAQPVAWTISEAIAVYWTNPLFYGAPVEIPAEPTLSPTF